MGSKPNIIGANFTASLATQIKVRQEKLGKPNPEVNDILYNNSKTSWLRVASGVDINDWDKTGLGEYNQFSAKDFVLFGGVTGEKGPQPLQPLATTTYDVVGDQIAAQYGIGNPSQWGYSPPPSVTSVDIQALNKGSIRKATLMLTAHNPDQFKILEILYLRLGFTILVEWGHTHYYDNEGDLQQMGNFSTTPFNTFFNSPGSQYEGFNALNDQIVEERKKYNYNYDAFIGFISNFQWSIGEGGVYNINLTVISPGALIESLTANRSTNEQDPKKGENSEGVAGNKIESYLNYWKNVLQKAQEDTSSEYEGSVEIETPTFDPEIFREYSDKDYPFAKNNIGDVSENVFSYKFKRKGEIIRYTYSQILDDESQQDSAYYYISLGALLELIEKSQYKDTKGIPIMSIDYDYNKSYMFSHPYQQSIYPDKCILSSTLYHQVVTYADVVTETEPISEDYVTSSDGETFLPFEPSSPEPEEVEPDLSVGVIAVQDTTAPINVYSSQQTQIEQVEEILSTRTIKNLKLGINTKEVPYFKSGDDPNITSRREYQGDIMGIMVNFDAVIQILQNTQDENGNVSLLSLIQNILNDITVSTGNLNSFEVTYNEDKRKVVIYDNKLPPGIQTPPSEEASFHIKGFQNQNNLEVGSFIKNFSFQSKIFPKLTNLIAISAQTGDTSLPDEGSSFQALNKNLTDRIMGRDSIKVDGNNSNNSTTQNYNSVINDINRYLLKIYMNRVYNTDNKDYSSTLKDILKYDVQVKVQTKKLPSPFFVPVTLSLTMDGLSGMTLWEKFGITPEYILPSDYPNNLDFIIQGVSHNIKDGKWVTTLETLSWPKPIGLEEEPTDILEGDGSANSSSPTPETPAEPDPEVNNSSWEIIPNSPPLYIRFKDDPTPLTPEDASAFVHPTVRPKFKEFFTRLATSSRYNGYVIRLGSAWRSIANQQGLANPNSSTFTTLATSGLSDHNLGTAIDMQIHKASSYAKVLGHKGTINQEWIDSGIIVEATKSGLGWGGEFDDRVHFFDPVTKAKRDSLALRIELYYGEPLSNLSQQQIFNIGLT